MPTALARTSPRHPATSSGRRSRPSKCRRSSRDHLWDIASTSLCASYVGWARTSNAGSPPYSFSNGKTIVTIPFEAAAPSGAYHSSTARPFSATSPFRLTCWPGIWDSRGLRTIRTRGGNRYRRRRSSVSWVHYSDSRSVAGERADPSNDRGVNLRREAPAGSTPGYAAPSAAMSSSRPRCSSVTSPTPGWYRKPE